MNTNDGGPAFPFGQISEETGAPINGYHNDGMSLRDWFAGQALAMLADSDVGNEPGWALNDGPTRLALSCYEIADAMIAEREKGRDK